MRKTILCAVLALAACASPEQRADALCAQRGYRPGVAGYVDCFTATHATITRAQMAAFANLSASGAAMMAAGAPRPIYPAAPVMMAAPTFPIRCVQWAGGHTVCN